jgi:hypothetical protein
MGKVILVILLFAAISFSQIANYPWLNPDSFPNAGPSGKCDTTGMLVPFSNICHGVMPYSARKTPPDPLNPGKFLAPVIDGFLENSIWGSADTLLVNGWEDAGASATCVDNPSFYGPLDLHAIWRVCYNHDGMYVSCEVHDDVWDVDSLKDWYAQDGIELAVDPWDWGGYPDKWANNQFNRYWLSNNTLNTSVTPYGQEEALAFFHILKRMNDEPYLTGLVYGVHLHNYGRGDEGTNFRRGESRLYGFDFACQAKVAIDPWGRYVSHVEIKIPYHTPLWNVLEGKGYFDPDGLPQPDKLFKLDVANNDDDVPGPDGSNPNWMQMSRRRGPPFFSSLSQHWSDVADFQCFKYSATAASSVVNVYPGLPQPPHGDGRVSDKWVDAATELIRYDFIDGGKCIIDSVQYYFDSTGLAGGKISSIQSSAQVGTYTYKPDPLKNNLLDTMTVVVGSNTYKIIRALTTGFVQVEGRWAQAHMALVPDPSCGNVPDTSWQYAANAKEFRFCPLTKIDTSKFPAYKTAVDSMRVYAYGKDSLVDASTYTFRSAVRGRTSNLFDYDIKKLYQAGLTSAPRNLIITYRDAAFAAKMGKQLNGVDTLVEIKGFNLMRFGESGAQSTLNPIPSNMVGKSGLYSLDTIADSVKKIQIVNKYRTDSLVLYPVLGAAAATNRMWVKLYPDMILCIDKGKASFWSRMFPVTVTTDTLYLNGYNPATKTATGVTPKNTALLVSPDSSWLQQVDIISVQSGKADPDTFKFLDTTQAVYWDYHVSVPSNLSNTIDTMICHPGVEKVADGEGIQVIAVENYPNPFNPFTVVRIAIPPQRVEARYALNIYDIRGQLVRTLVKGSVGKPGLVRKIVWDGMDNLGRSVGAGVYFYRLNVGDKIRKGSMVFVK